MRIVQFNAVESNGRIAYPAEGIHAFGRTELIDGKIVGEYLGAADEATLPSYAGAWPPVVTRYKTALNNGEVLQLLGAEAYAAVFKAAYPKDDTPVDVQALFFLESAKHPYSANGLLDVNVPPVTDAMAYFVAVGYITQADADRVTRGKPL